MRRYNCLLFDIELTTVIAPRNAGGRRIKMKPLSVGEAAPDFELPAVTGKRRHQFKLSEFRDQKHVVIAFYPLDWSPA